MSHPARHTTLAALVALLVLVLVPTVVVAHAELEDSNPSKGETVTGTPPIIEATYSEDLDLNDSSLILVDADGTEIASGGPAGAAPTRQMTITDLPELAPGEYTVRSTTKSADDGDIERTTWTFTVIAAPSQTPGPTPICTDECPGQPSGGEVVSASPSVSATAAPASASAPASPAAASPTPTASADAGDGASGSGDAILPIIAGLAIVAIAAVVLVRRRGRSTPSA